MLGGVAEKFSRLSLQGLKCLPAPCYGPFTKSGPSWFLFSVSASAPYGFFFFKSSRVGNTKPCHFPRQWCIFSVKQIFKIFFWGHYSLFFLIFTPKANNNVSKHRLKQEGFPRTLLGNSRSPRSPLHQEGRGTSLWRENSIYNRRCCCETICLVHSELWVR